MIKNISIVLVLLSSGLFAMGDTINYDDKFDEVEAQEVNSNVLEEKSDTLLTVRLKSFTFQERNGRNVPVKQVKKGSKVIYINTVINKDIDIKENIVVKNPIPQGATYIIGSATCDNACTISYSTDGGHTLTQKQNSEEKYNYIEFFFKMLPVDKEFRMGFRAIVGK